MGCVSSKHKERPQNSVRQSSAPWNRGEFLNEVVDSKAKRDANYIEHYLYQLENEPTMFILNNLLYSVMFFEHYSEEMTINKHQLNAPHPVDQTLLGEEGTRCIRPDSIIEIISKHVVFRPEHGEKKLVSELLAPKRIFLINDVIEVLNSDDDAHYDSVDKPGYKFKMEHTDKKGYVYLQYLENLKDNRSLKDDKENYYTVREPQAGPSNRPDDVDDYLEITKMRTPQQIEVSENEDGVRKSFLPNDCFALKKFDKLDAVQDVEDVDKIAEEELYEYKKYLRSKGYMKHFQSNIFPKRLAKKLKFRDDDVRAAKWVPGKVILNSFEFEDNHCEQWEMLPAIAINWPTKHTLDFVYRESRIKRTNTATGVSYEWPDENTIKKIQETKAVVIPKGCYSKIKNTAENTIEWEICFPKAEQILESKMSHAQIRVYFILLTIHKTFIEPKTKQQGLLPEHIRTHMFWEMEDNFKAWPDHRIAEKLVLVIGNLIERLRTRQLPDFFISRKNLFSNIVNQYLDFAHQVFHDILELPFTHMIQVTRNLRYRHSGSYYPFIDLKILRSFMDKHTVEFKGKPTTKNTKIFTGNEDAEQKHKMLVLEKQKEKKEKENHEKEQAEAKRKSIDSLDLNWAPPKTIDVDQKSRILKFYIDFFIKIVKKSKQISSAQHTKLWCKQVLYLCEMLAVACPNLSEIAANYKDSISQYIEETKEQLDEKKSHMKPRPPSTQSIPHPQHIHQSVGGTNIRMSNLNRNYMGESLEIENKNGSVKGKRKMKLSVKIAPSDIHQVDTPPTPTKNVRFG